MIAAPRVLLVTRRFWPLANDNVCRLMSLAGALRSAGWDVQLLTAQWHTAWPERVELSELLVHRVGPSPTTPFRAKRYTRAVSDWLTKHASAFDCLVIDSWEDEVLTLTSHPSKDLPPIVVRHDALEGIGPLAERQRARAITACKQAACVIAPHDHALRELVSGGLSMERIISMPDGPYPKVARDESARAQARRALADINHELYVRTGDRLCICPSELTKSASLEFLIRTLGPIIETRQDLRCWLVGDGPDRSRLYELTQREGWRNDFSMPGTFEDLDVVMAAADLCVIPGMSQGLSWVVPTALSNGLTTFFCESAAARARLGNNTALMFEQGNSQQLSERIEQWLEQPKEFKAIVARVCERLPSATSIIDRWRGLVAELLLFARKSFTAESAEER